MKSELHTGASLVELAVKNPSANAGDVRDVGLIPGTEEPGGYDYIGSQRVRHV